ncbi:MAG: hypothetical protein A3F74_26080 [Betaproteobacteria bacterium RIFCSPLOWO2_12_FULL_62_58]|nr:MAG: hypothetical protein A3F74_26080 [Betaproteobacteria bacterium RIFCSPLOWO2_12_FULL_62_58]
MIATDNFANFGRRVASTQGFPYLVIAETPNPVRQLDAAALHARAEVMIGTVIDGLTLSPAAIERRVKNVARQQIHPDGVVRSAVPV